MKNQKPAWWQLFVLVPLMFGLIGLEHLAPLPGISDEIVDIGIVSLTFLAMVGWVHVNSGLLERYELDRDKSLDELKITVYEPVSKIRESAKSSEDSFTSEASLAGHIQNNRRVRIKEEDIWFLN